ncbi:MAG: vanadium-dependent haloperoxidase [Sarcina sp.]
MDINNYINKCCCHCDCDYEPYKKWSEIPYPGTSTLPIGKDPTAGTWPLHYMKKVSFNTFFTLSGKKIVFDIDNPNTIDFKKDLLEVQMVQSRLTPNQKSLAKFWGTGVPPQQWLPIFLEFISLYKVTPPSSARILASLQNAMSDAFCITWMYKYYWDAARPCQLDRNLKTFLPTPIFPTYPSGHSVVSGAIEVVLSFFFPDEACAVHQLAEDASISRLYGGIHFRSDLSEGLKLGRQIGAVCVEQLKTEPEIEKLIYRE